MFLSSTNFLSLLSKNLVNTTHALWQFFYYLKIIKMGSTWHAWEISNMLCLSNIIQYGESCFILLYAYWDCRGVILYSHARSLSNSLMVSSIPLTMLNLFYSPIFRLIDWGSYAHVWLSMKHRMMLCNNLLGVVSWRIWWRSWWIQMCISECV